MNKSNVPKGAKGLVRSNTSDNRNALGLNLLNEVLKGSLFNVGLNKQQRIRLFYKENFPYIKERWSKGGIPGILGMERAYQLDFLGGGSVVEGLAYSDILENNLFLLPQFPVLGFFIDFANPFLKLAIEIDGDAYHNDKEYDIYRQRRIEALGWSFVRFPATYVYKTADQVYYSSQAEYLDEPFCHINNPFYIENSGKSFSCFCHAARINKVFNNPFN